MINTLSEGDAKLLTDWAKLFGCSVSDLIRLTDQRVLRKEGDVHRLSFVGILVAPAGSWYVRPAILKSTATSALFRELQATDRILRVYESRSRARKPVLDLVHLGFFQDELARQQLAQADLLAALLTWTADYGFHYQEASHDIDEAGTVAWPATFAASLPLILRRSIVYTEPIKLRHSMAISPVGCLQGRAIVDLASRHSALIGSIFPHVSDLLVLAEYAAEEAQALVGHPGTYLNSALAATNKDHDRELIQLLLAFYEGLIAAPTLPVALYGTAAFQLVWEDICRFVLGAEDSQIAMSNPVYNVGGMRRATDAQRPDLTFRQNTRAYVVDAKYYVRFPEAIPQLEDVRKQIFYGLTSREAMSPGLAFVFPGKTGEMLSYLGMVTLEAEGTRDLRFSPVHCFSLDWTYAAQAYASRRTTVNLQPSLAAAIETTEGA